MEPPIYIEPARDWEEYEDQIFGKLSREFPDHKILEDQMVRGRFSGIDRQVDIVVRREVIGHEIAAVVDCKLFSRNVDVGDVDQFAGFVSDLNAEIGIIITNVGHSRAALQRARNDRGLRIHVVEFEHLETYRFVETCRICPDAHDGVPGSLSVEGFYNKDGETDNPEGALVSLMHCDVCGSHHVRCEECGVIGAVYDTDYGEELECEGGCGLRFLVEQVHAGDGLYEYFVRILG